MTQHHPCSSNARAMLKHHARSNAPVAMHVRTYATNEQLLTFQSYPTLSNARRGG